MRIVLNLWKLWKADFVTAKSRCPPSVTVELSKEEVTVGVNLRSRQAGEDEVNLQSLDLQTWILAARAARDLSWRGCEPCEGDSRRCNVEIPFAIPPEPIDDQRKHCKLPEIRRPISIHASLDLPKLWFAVAMRKARKAEREEEEREENPKRELSERDRSGGTEFVESEWEKRGRKRGFAYLIERT